SLLTCWIRFAMAHPCLGSRATVLRMRRSSVPWIKSDGLLMVRYLSYRQLMPRLSTLTTSRQEMSRPPCQDQRFDRRGDTVLLEAVRSEHVLWIGRPTNRAAAAELRPLHFTGISTLMRYPRVPAVLLLFAILFIGAAGEGRAEETIVFLRHGEKPSGGYGQLTCQGFNRSLALPAVLLAKYGRPNILYAPNPAVTLPDPA